MFWTPWLVDFKNFIILINPLNLWAGHLISKNIFPSPQKKPITHLLLNSCLLLTFNRVRNVHLTCKRIYRQNHGLLMQIEKKQIKAWNLTLPVYNHIKKLLGKLLTSAIKIWEEHVLSIWVKYVTIIYNISLPELSHVFNDNAFQNNNRGVSYHEI